MLKALRIGYHTIASDAEFAHSLALVRDNIDVVDEIAIFTEPTHHGYCPLPRAAHTSELLKKRIRAYKDAGVKKVGINILCTIGHTEDGGKMHERADLRYMMNIAGTSSASCLCPSDERFLPYITKRYEMYAQTGADFIWLDDDVRIGNHGVVRECCFCPDCLSRFNERNQTVLALDEVRRLFPADGAFRAKWLKSAEDTITQMIEVITQTVKRVNPAIEMGFMSGEGNSVPAWFRACGATKGRPGGGFYNDRSPVDLLEKHFSMQKCLMRYPDTVTDLQYEYESYNFLSLEKSLHTTEMETSLAITSGCNGILYNRWYHTPDFLEMVRRSAHKWDVLVAHTEKAKPIGIWCQKGYVARRLNEIGLPVTAYFEHATAYCILGDEWYGFSDEQVRDLMKKGVLTDARGAEILISRGLSDVGGKVNAQYANGVYEHFSSHPFNGEYAESDRFVSLDIFYEGDAFSFDLAKGSQPLSYLTTPYEQLGCSAFYHPRPDGSAIAVDGCLMIRQVQSANKRRQLIRLFDRLSGAALPVLIEKSCKASPILTKNPDGILTLTLVNAHFDALHDLTVKVRGGEGFSLLDADGSLAPIAQTTENGETRITIPEIKGWDYVVLTGRAIR